MAKSIHFKGKDLSFIAGITKVDRKKIYGYSVTQVTDKDNNLCSLATLGNDGVSILPSGSTGLAKFDSENNYIDNSLIKVINEEGNPAQIVPSIFDGEVEVIPSNTIEDYLDLNVKSIYQLSPNEEDISTLNSFFKDNLLLEFIFNYRADYEGDNAFIIQSEGTFFVVVGYKCEFEYIGLEEKVEVLDDNEEDEDDFDFGML